MPGKKPAKGNGMWIYFLFALYIACSAFGLVLIKSGGSDLKIGMDSGIFNLNISLKMLLGMLLYVCSFLLFVFIVPRFNLSYIYPLAAGILYVIITLISVLYLKEKLTAWQISGMFMILLGVIAINIKGVNGWS